MIDNSKLVEKAEEIWCPETWDVVWIEFIACALHWTHGKWTALNRAFVTMYYNELLNYRVFIAYYSEMLSNMIKADNDQQSKNVKENELRDVQKYSSMQLEAAKQTLEDFSELNITYPLHIGLLMYQERAMYFREKFSPIVTIFYSLSEKLQNVQIPS